MPAVVAMAALLVAPRPAPAHERHPAATQGRAARQDTLQARPFAMPPVRDAMLHHLHNKLVHFPIALAPVAVLLLLAERRRPGLGAAGVGLVWLAAAGAAAAYFAGRAQEKAFHGDPKEWLAGVHETWGTAAAVALLAWALLSLWPAGRRYLWLWGLLATATVLGAAFFGGLVAHG